MVSLKQNALATLAAAFACAMVYLCINAGLVTQFLFVVGSIIFAYMTVKRNLSGLMITTMFTGVFTALYAAGHLEFNFLPQVLQIIGLNPIELFLEGHEWGPRYIVSYPAVIFSEMFSISLNEGYTVYVVLLFLTMVQMNVRAAKDSGAGQIKAGMIAILSVTFLSFIMNGRVIPAFMGLTLILYLQNRILLSEKIITFKQYIGMFAGFFLSTVTSGVMMVSLLQILVFTFVYNRRAGKTRRTFLFFVAISAVFGPYILFMIQKNLDYFGGGWLGFWNMLNHGLGRVLHYETLIYILAAGGLTGIVVFWGRIKKYLSYDKSFHLKIVVPICLMCGMFGLSTASMIIPGIIMIISLKVSRIKV